MVWPRKSRHVPDCPPSGRVHTAPADPELQLVAAQQEARVAWNMQDIAAATSFDCLYAFLHQVRVFLYAWCVHGSHARFTSLCPYACVWNVGLPVLTYKPLQALLAQSGTSGHGELGLIAVFRYPLELKPCTGQSQFKTSQTKPIAIHMPVIIRETKTRMWCSGKHSCKHACMHRQGVWMTHTYASLRQSMALAGHYSRYCVCMDACMQTVTSEWPSRQNELCMVSVVIPCMWRPGCT